jgi:hypothetical protein
MSRRQQSRQQQQQEQRQPLLQNVSDATDVEAPPPAPARAPSTAAAAGTTAAADAEAAPRVGVLRLLAEAKPEAGTITIATLFLFIAALANLAIPKIAGRLIDACTQAAAGQITTAAARALLDQNLYLVLAVMAAGGLASGLRAYLFNSAAERVMCRLRVRLFTQVGGSAAAATAAAAAVAMWLAQMCVSVRSCIRRLCTLE